MVTADHAKADGGGFVLLLGLVIVAGALAAWLLLPSLSSSTASLTLKVYSPPLESLEVAGLLEIAQELIVEPSKHVQTLPIARLVSWAALKSCGEHLEIYQCHRVYPDGGEKVFYVALCPDAEGKMCAVGIIGLPRPDGTSIGITTYPTSCKAIRGRLTKWRCQRASVRLEFSD